MLCVKGVEGVKKGRGTREPRASSLLPLTLFIASRPLLLLYPATLSLLSLLTLIPSVSLSHILPPHPPPSTSSGVVYVVAPLPSLSHACASKDECVLVVASSSFSSPIASHTLSLSTV